MQEPSATAAGRERAPTAQIFIARFRDAHHKSEPKSISDPFEPPLFRRNPPFSLQDPRWGPWGLRGGDRDLETHGVFPLYPDPVLQQE